MFKVSKTTKNLCLHKVCLKSYKKNIFEQGISIINLSLNELKLIAKNRGIKDYVNKSEDDLIKILSEPKTRMSLSKKIIKRIKEKNNKLIHRCSKPEIKEIRRNLYHITKTKKNSASKIKEIEKNLLESEKNLFKPEKYYDYDDIKYKGIRDVGNLLDLSIDKDYNKPIRANSVFNSNHIEYESKGDKYKILSIIEYVNMIRQYLSDIINYHKTQGELKVHSGNTVADYKTQGKWKIQLTMSINFISSKGSDETLLCMQKVII